MILLSLLVSSLLQGGGAVALTDLIFKGLCPILT